MAGRLDELRQEAGRRASTRDFGTASEQLNRDILELAPADTGSMNRLATCLLERGAVVEAEAVWQRVIEIHPENRLAIRRLQELRGVPVTDEPRRPGRRRLDRAPVPPGGLDPTSESAAATVIESLYPDEGERLTCLRRMAASIRLVDHLSPDHWEITLYPRRARLNVSKLAAFDLSPGKLRLLVDKAGVPIDVWNLSVAIGGPPKAGFHSASNLEWIDLPSHRLDELLPRSETAHRKAVLQASEGGRSPYLRYHSPGVVKYLNRTLGEHIVGPWD